MKVLLEARKRWQWVNLIIIIRMFPVITEQMKENDMSLRRFPMLK